MNEDYLQDFIRESEENIVDLNNSLLALEDDPSDQEAMDQIFRTAHTLKGNFSAMGFEGPGALAHAIEDLLDEIKDGNLVVTAEVMDSIFEGVDAIEAAINQIEADGTASVETETTIDAIRSHLGGQATPADGTTTPANDGAPLDRVLAEVSTDDWSSSTAVVHAHVTLEDSDMPGVDGMLVLDDIADSLALIDTVPPANVIEDGEHDGEFHAFVETDEIEPVESTVAGLTKVESIEATVVDLDDLPDTPAQDSDTRTEPSEVTEDSAAHSVDEIKSVRVDVDQLDELYNRIEQLVTSRIKLRRSVEDGNIETTIDNLDELDKISSSLQGTVMDMRLIPLKKVVNTFPRMVRDIAREQGKEVDFEMTGTDIELDRTILDEISDPLMHVLRNAIDHGIEPPDIREATDKPREGEIRLRAKRERDYVTITVSDDGGGLDAEALREKALEKGIKSESELSAMDESAVHGLIFHPGFSTTDEVTDVSGRGVGMDVVKNTVNRLDGAVSVESIPSEGTTIQLRLPVTVAIVRVLFVEVDGEEYGIPIKTVDEITRPTGIETVNGEPVIDHDGTVYPVISLRSALEGGPPRTNGDGMLLRIRESERPVALRCDTVKHQEEVVIKPLEGSLGNVDGVGGTAVIGDGNVIPILDVGTL